MRTLEQRLDSIELQFRRARQTNRALAFALAVVVCVAGAQLADPQPQPPKAVSPADSHPPEDRASADNDRVRTVEADRFVLIDRHGRARITLAVTESGPVISMRDEQGRRRLELTQAADASGVSLLDANEAPLASLQVGEDGEHAQLEIRNPNGRVTASGAGLVVRDRADQVRLQLALINGSFPVLGISQSDQSGPASVEITASEDGARALTIHDKSGYPLFSVSASEEGATHLNLRHPAHARSLQISSGPREQDGPQIAFFAPARQDGTGGQLAPLQLGFRMNQQPYIRIADSHGNALFTAPAK